MFVRRNRPERKVCELRYRSIGTMFFIRKKNIIPNTKEECNFYYSPATVSKPIFFFWSIFQI